MPVSHVLITNPAVHGYAYGVLRDLESAIVRATGAATLAVPPRPLPRSIAERVGHGMRYSMLRGALPKAELKVRADVMWMVLMGPENFELDLYRDWSKHVGFKILYIFDTLPDQLPVLRRVLQAAHWDVTVTSFASAVPFLENATQRRWHAVAQGVNLARFEPASDADRLIDFSAYGRRLPRLHRFLKEQCPSRRKYYDYSSSAGLSPDVDSLDAYAQYAWHLTHSAFTFCWPVEVTHPRRASGLSPVTCRWFEAAASGAVIIGQPPRDPAFAEHFGPDSVLEVSADIGAGEFESLLDELEQRRGELLAAALQRRESLAANWTWKKRVAELLALIENTRGVVA